MAVLSLEAYSTGTTRIVDPGDDIKKAAGLNFNTQYPGGIFGEASFFVPRRVTDWWELKGAKRVVMRYGLKIAYEGFISNIQSQVGSPEGMLVNAIGAWGHVLMNWGIRKLWADTRLGDDVWKWQTDVAVYSSAEKCTIDRNARLRFTPKNVAWTTDTCVAVRHTQPIGQTTKRVQYSYDFSEGAQAWEISMWRSTDGAAWTQMTNASGETYTTGTTTVIVGSATGDINVTLGTPSRYIELRYYARADQTPTSDGAYYGEFSALQVFSETGNINMEEVVKDVVGIVTDLNTSTQFINASGSPLNLVPFIEDDFISAADVLTDASEKGDAAYARWAVYTVDSERVSVPNGKAPLSLAAYVSTSDYDYVIDYQDYPGLVISQDTDNLGNWIVVEYTDPEDNRQVRTPDDEAALKNDTSITTYGRHTMVISMGVATAAMADSYGQKILAMYKDPQYHLESPITVTGSIRGKNQNETAACMIQARKRIRIENYLANPLTFVITQTAYDDDTETCTINVGEPMAPLMPRYAWSSMGGHEDISHTGEGGAVIAATRGGGGGRSITDAQLKKWGMTRQEWWAIKATARGKALRASLKKKKKRG